MKDIYRKWLKISVLAICVGIMLCVWPFCLFRRVQGVYSRLDSNFVATVERITQEKALEQSFIAQTSYLDSVSIDVGYDVENPKGFLRFEQGVADVHLYQVRFQKK